MLLAMLLGAGTRAGAQATPYVPLDDIAYRYVDALMARGEMSNVSALERPYTAAELQLGAYLALTHTHSPVIRSYAIALYTALTRYGWGTTELVAADPSRPRFFVNGDVFATAQTSGTRELMQADTLNSVTGGAGVRLAMTSGPFVMMLHPVIDNRLNNDPQFAGRKDRSIAARTEDAYLTGQWDYARLFVGRIGRNWGPPSMDGLALGASAYSYDHLYARFGTDNVHLSSIAAKLDDRFEPDGVYARYFYTHRIGVTWRWLEAGINEAYLASGIGRSYDLSLVNPLNLYALSWRDERLDGNLNIGGDIAIRTQRYGTYAAELLIDDMQIDKCDTTCNEPSSYGLTITGEGIPLAGDHRAFASYTRLTGLAYRTPKAAEEYSSFGIGLGRGFTDYDELRAGVDLALIPYTTLRVYGAYRRQGQGDYHLPFPLPAEYSTTPGFLLGTVERTSRFGVTGALMAAPGVEVTADGGLNHVTNAGHVVGAHHTGFEGRLRMQWTPKGWSGTL